MPYAIIREHSIEGVKCVVCVTCRAGIGTMKIATIIKALGDRGTLICPECRKKKCDYCGLYSPEELVPHYSSKSEAQFRICNICIGDALYLEVPKCELFLHLEKVSMLEPGEAIFEEDDCPGW